MESSIQTYPCDSICPLEAKQMRIPHNSSASGASCRNNLEANATSFGQLRNTHTLRDQSEKQPCTSNESRLVYSFQSSLEKSDNDVTKTNSSETSKVFVAMDCCSETCALPNRSRKHPNASDDSYLVNSLQTSLEQESENVNCSKISNNACSDCPDASCTTHIQRGAFVKERAHDSTGLSSPVQSPQSVSNDPHLVYSLQISVDNQRNENSTETQDSETNTNACTSSNVYCLATAHENEHLQAFKSNINAKTS